MINPLNKSTKPLKAYSSFPPSLAPDLPFQIFADVEHFLGVVLFEIR